MRAAGFEPASSGFQTVKQKKLQWKPLARLHLTLRRLKPLGYALKKVSGWQDLNLRPQAYRLKVIAVQAFDKTPFTALYQTELHPDILLYDIL